MRHFVLSLLRSGRSVALLLALLLPIGAAQGDPAPADPGAGAAGFAALDIVPAGEQIFDISSGRTLLPDGGEVIDHATGVRLLAPYIAFAEGRSLEATDVLVTGSFGSFRAATLTIDIEGALLSAAGGVLLERDSLTLTAPELIYDAGAEIARFSGPVTGTDPDFEAAGLLLDTLSGTVMLLGPYRFQDGPLTLASSRDDGRLELVFTLLDGEPNYSAATEISAETHERFADHLP